MKKPNPNRRHNRQLTSPKHIARQEKALKAVELRLAGMGLEAIAKTLGYSDRGNAFRAIESVLVARAEDAAESLDQMRAIEVERLDKMHLKLWRIISDAEIAPDVCCRAIDRALRIQERRAKLLGLDAPTRVTLTDSDAAATMIEDARAHLASAIAQISESIDSATAQRPSGQAPN